MANINITATASAAAAIAEIEALKAAIASVTGKTVRIGVEVDGARDALGGLNQLGAARRAAGGDITISTGQARSNVDRLGGSLRTVGRDADRAGRDGADGMARLGRGAATARSNVGGLAREADRFRSMSSAELTRMGVSLSKFGEGAAVANRDALRATNGIGGLVRAQEGFRAFSPAEVERVGKGVAKLGDEADRAFSGSKLSATELTRMGAGLAKFGQEAEIARNGAGGLVREADGFRAFSRAEVDRMGTRLAKFSDESDRAGSSVRRVSDTVSDLGRGASAAGGALEGALSVGGGFARSIASLGPGGSDPVFAVVKGLVAVTAGAGVAAAGAGIVTGAVGAMGVASVGAFGLLGAGMAVGAGAFVEHAVDVLKESGKFRGEFNRIARDAQSWQEDTFEPVGDTIVGLANTFRAAAPGLGAPIKAGLGAARDAILDSAPDLLRGSQTIADSIGRITKDTAPSIGTLARSFPALASSTTGAMEEITRAFNAGFQEQWPRAVPHIQKLAGSVGDFGAEVMRVGAANMVPFVDGLDSMTDHATAMVRNLGPSIPKAMAGFVDIANIGMDALGSPQVAEGIDKFTGAISRNQGPLTAFLSSLAEGGFGAGTGFVEGVAGAAPAVDYMGDRLAANQQNIADFTDATVSAVAGTIGFATDLFVGAPAELARNIGWLFGGGEEAAPPPPPPPDVPPGSTQAPLSWANAWQRAGLAQGARMIPSDRIPAEVGVTPYQVPDLASQIDPSTGIMTGPKADAIKEHFGIVGDYYTDAAKAPPSRPAAPFVAPQLPGIPGGSIPMPGPQFSTMLPQPVEPPPPPAASMEELLGGQVKPRVGSSLGGMVRRQVVDAAPEVEQAGTQLGGSVGAGMDQGITQSITRTVTVMRRTIKRIIDVAAEELDSHSPSRVFGRLGQSIPGGLAVGVDSGAAQAVTATARMTAGVVQAGASQAALQQAGVQAGGAYMAGMSTGMATPPAQPTPPIPPTSGAPLAGLGGLTNEQMWGFAPTAAEAQADATQKRMAAITAARQNAENDRRGQLERFGWNPSTVDRVLEREAKHQERAEGIRQRRQDNMEAAIRRASPNMSDAAFNQMMTERKPGNTSFAYTEVIPSPPKPPVSSSFEGPNPGGRAATAARVQGRDVGQSYSQGVGQGVTSGEARVGGAGRSLSEKLDEETKRALGIKSPSRLAAESGSAYADGLGAGMAAGVSNASSQVLGVASDRGLQVGYSWARSVVSGADVVLKRADFEAVSVPKVDSPQAKAALGKAGLLGPAGSGASIWKTPMVTLPVPAPQQVVSRVDLTVNLDGQVLRRMTAEQVNDAIDNLAHAISLQAG